jgi:hypothetical protein
MMKTSENSGMKKELRSKEEVLKKLFQHLAS